MTSVGGDGGGDDLSSLTSSSGRKTWPGAVGFPTSEMTSVSGDGGGGASPLLTSSSGQVTGPGDGGGDASSPLISSSGQGTGPCAVKFPLLEMTSVSDDAWGSASPSPLWHSELRRPVSPDPSHLRSLLV